MVEKQMQIELEGSKPDLYADYDPDLINELTEKEGWIEFVRTNGKGEEEHLIYNPVAGPIRFIKYIK